MTKINNLDDATRAVMRAMEQLIDGEIDEKQATAISKMNDSMVKNIKIKLDFAKQAKLIPHVPAVGLITNEK